jgi:hypothetical protein
MYFLCDGSFRVENAGRSIRILTDDVHASIDETKVQAVSVKRIVTGDKA